MRDSAVGETKRTIAIPADTATNVCSAKKYRHRPTVSLHKLCSSNRSQAQPSEVNREHRAECKRSALQHYGEQPEPQNFQRQCDESRKNVEQKPCAECESGRLRGLWKRRIRFLLAKFCRHRTRLRLVTH